MSKLSVGLSKLAASAKNAVHQPLRALANVATLGQLSTLQNALHSRNGATLLGTVLGGPMGASFGALKDQNDVMKQKQQDYLNQQTDKQNATNTNLNQVLNGISGNGSTPINGVSTQPYFGPVPGVSNQPQQNPSIPTGGLPFDTLSPEIQQTLAAQSPALADRLKQIIGPGTGEAQTSAGQLLNANDLATQLSQQTLDKQTAARKQQISDLSDVLTKQAQTQYERSLPGLYEDLNTRGLLRSSELGNQMATKEQQSYQDVANELAKQQLGYNDEAISGMGDITKSYNSGVGSALQREFSLQDYANQVAASKALGQAVAPVQPYNGKNTTQAVGNVAAIGSTGAKLAGK